MRLMFVLGIGVSLVAYKNIKSTYIEIREDGLFYHYRFELEIVNSEAPIVQNRGECQ